MMLWGRRARAGMVESDMAPPDDPFAVLSLFNHHLALIIHDFAGEKRKGALKD
jgi:hypothetical protein